SNPHAKHVPRGALRAAPYGPAPIQRSAAYGSSLAVKVRQREAFCGIQKHGEERLAAPCPVCSGRAQHIDQDAEFLARWKNAKDDDMTVAFAPRQVAKYILERIPVASEPGREGKRLGEVVEEMFLRIHDDDVKLRATRRIQDVLLLPRSVHAGLDWIGQPLEQ